MKTRAAFALLLALVLGTSVAEAKTKSTAPKAAVKALMNVPATELPTVAAMVVVASPKEVQLATLEAVLRHIARSRPSALPHVVGAVVKGDSSLATAAAGLAAKAQPEAVGAIAAAACAAAPRKAASIIAVCSRVTVVGTGALSEMVARIDPEFVAQSLASEASAVDVTSSATFAEGGLPLVPLNPPPGSIGYTMLGDLVITAPPGSTGVDGFDPDRYAH